MYDVIYDDRVGARIAALMPSPIYTDLEGNQVFDVSLQVGLKQEVMITKPLYILFVNASGFWPSQKRTNICMLAVRS